MIRVGLFIQSTEITVQLKISLDSSCERVLTGKQCDTEIWNEDIWLDLNNTIGLPRHIAFLTSGEAFPPMIKIRLPLMEQTNKQKKYFVNST